MRRIGGESMMFLSMAGCVVFRKNAAML